MAGISGYCVRTRILSRVMMATESLLLRALPGDRNCRAMRATLRFVYASPLPANRTGLNFRLWNHYRPTIYPMRSNIRKAMANVPPMINRGSHRSPKTGLPVRGSRTRSESSFENPTARIAMPAISPGHAGMLRNRSSPLPRPYAPDAARNPPMPEPSATMIRFFVSFLSLSDLVGARDAA